MHRYLQNNICYFRSPISPWRGPQWKSLFGAFFLGKAYIFTIPKISLHWGPLQPFLKIDHDFGHICFLNNLWKKIGNKFGSLPSQKVQNFVLGRFIERETRVYFWPFFLLSKPLRAPLPYSAMSLSMIALCASICTCRLTRTQRTGFLRLLS